MSIVVIVHFVIVCCCRAARAVMVRARLLFYRTQGENC